MSNRTGGTRTKVARLIDEYDLHGIGAELERRWTRTENRSSLRDLADYFNRELLDAAFDTMEVEPLDGGVDNVYRLLTDEDVTSGVRQETRSRLKQRGLDVDSIESDFVSYQAVRSYLQDVRNASPPDTDLSAEAYRERKRTTVQQLVGRLTTVTEDALTELVKAGALTLGEFDVLVTVRVHCMDCDTRLGVAELLRDGHCRCEADSP